MFLLHATMLSDMTHDRESLRMDKTTRQNDLQELLLGVRLTARQIAKKYLMSQNKMQRNASLIRKLCWSTSLNAHHARSPSHSARTRHGPWHHARMKSSGTHVWWAHARHHTGSAHHVGVVHTRHSRSAHRWVHVLRSSLCVELLLKLKEV